MTATTATMQVNLSDLTSDEVRSCDRCLERLTTILEDEAGIVDFQINADQGIATVEYDSKVTNPGAIKALVQEEAQRVGLAYVHRVFPIEGMHCADCAATLERGVSRLEGIESVAVNFGAAQMVIEYDAEQTTPEAITRRVAEFGYRVGDETPTAAPEHNNALVSFITEGENLVTLLGALLTLLGIISSVMPAPQLVATSFYAAAILVAGVPIARKGFASIRINHQLDINILMTIAVVGAAFIGEWLEAATVVVLFSLGEALEDYSMDRARRSIRSLMSLTPDEALVRREGQEQTIPVADIVPGDIVIIRPGGRIPVDGVVATGQSSVNQAPVTGESIPVEKTPDAQVFSGTINGPGVLEIRTSRPASDSTIARIIHMVEEAQARKAPSQRFVDVFAKYYTPAIVVAAALIALAPPLMFGSEWSSWFYRALVLLVIACPCALVISTPVSIVSAISSAARSGVLIKGGAYLEAVGSLRAVAFDKTGTLTFGEPAVSTVIALNRQTEDNVLRFAAAAERYSEHPLGEAIVQAAVERQLDLASLPAMETQSYTGAGIEAQIDGMRVRVGTRALVLNDSVPTEADEQLTVLERAGQTAVLVGVNDELIGIIGLADTLRPEAEEAIKAIRVAGIERTIMLTGDRREVAETIAGHAGIDSVKAELLPDQKVEAITELLHAYERVGMVGDGVNDAPALARATVGIAMGAAGTDTALETADVALMGDDLTKTSFTVRLSRSAKQIIKQNIGLALGVKTVVLLLAIAGMATLWQAIIADVGASLVVILNGLRLLHYEGDTSDTAATNAR